MTLKELKVLSPRYSNWIKYRNESTRPFSTKWPWINHYSYRLKILQLFNFLEMAIRLHIVMNKLSKIWYSGWFWPIRAKPNLIFELIIINNFFRNFYSNAWLFSLKRFWTKKVMLSFERVSFNAENSKF